MILSKRLSSLATSFTVAASLVFSPQSASALELNAKNAPVSFRTAQQRTEICARTDFITVARQEDYAGLFTAIADCKVGYELTKNPVFMQRAAVGAIFQARYVHDHPRGNGSLADPEAYMVGPKDWLIRAESQGVNIEPSIKFYNDTLEYIRRPITSPKFDASLSTSCILDANPDSNDRNILINWMNVCAKAYNEKPLPVVAYSYAASAHYLARNIYKNDPNNPESIKIALIAKNFFMRAAKEGIVNDRLLSANERIINRSEDCDTKCMVGIAALVVVFAVAAYAILSSGGTASAVVAGSSGAKVGTGAAVAADLAAAAKAEQVMELTYFLAQRQAAAIALEKAATAAGLALVP